MGLEDAYNHARDIIGLDRAECLEAAVEVDSLRRDQRPDRVRIVVLAESHVWTSREEVQSRVTLPNDKTTGFARFVYCLGAGEPGLVKPKVTPNSSTHQFWTLLHDTVRGPNVSHSGLLKRGERNLQKRVKNKLALLDEMRRAGIWLVDASVTALVKARDKRTGNNKAGDNKLADGRIYKKVLQVCWKDYVGGVVRDYEPSAILIVGKGVRDAIRDVMHDHISRKTEVVTIKQPNALRGTEEIAHNRRTCFELCRRHRAENIV